MHATRTFALLPAFTMNLGSLLADDIERDPINYSKATPNNIITQFQERISNGKAVIQAAQCLFDHSMFIFQNVDGGHVYSLM